MTQRIPQAASPDGSLGYIAIICFAASALLAVQFVFPGYYFLDDADAAVIPKYVPQIAESFRQGIFYPRWMAEDFFGYGSPRFVFYPPLVYLLSSLLYLFGLSLPLSLTVLKLLGLSIGGIFLFLFLREKVGVRAALIAAVCYLFLPTRTMDVYQINTFAGRFSQAWMPVVLFFADRVAAGPLKRGYLAGMGLSYAALILSHIATAFIFTPFIIAYGVFGDVAAGRLKAVLRLSAGLLIGVCLSAFYFVPVLMERGYLRLEYVVTSLFPYWNNFVFNIFHQPGTFKEAPPWSFLVSSITVEVISLGVLYYLARRYQGLRIKRITTFSIVAVLACLFMMSSLSGLVWRYVPGLSTVQFPYRFEVVYLVFVCVLFGVTVDSFIEWKGRPGRITAVVLAMLVLAITYDARIIFKTTPYTEAESESLARESHWIDYLPATVSLDNIPALKAGDPLISPAGGSLARIIRWGYTEREFTVGSTAAQVLRIKTYFFPGWRAWVDGAEIPVRPEEVSGAILLDVPAGTHEVELRFEDTAPRTYGAALSIITLAALAFPYGLLRRKAGGRAP